MRQVLISVENFKIMLKEGRSLEEYFEFLEGTTPPEAALEGADAIPVEGAAEEPTVKPDAGKQATEAASAEGEESPEAEAEDVTKEESADDGAENATENEEEEEENDE